MTTYTIVEVPHRHYAGVASKWAVISEHTGERVTADLTFDHAVEFVLFALEFHYSNGAA